MKLNRFWEGVSTGIAWLLLLVGIPLALAFTGFALKLLWACLLLGWNIL